MYDTCYTRTWTDCSYCAVINDRLTGKRKCIIVFPPQREDMGKYLFLKRFAKRPRWFWHAVRCNVRGGCIKAVCYTSATRIIVATFSQLLLSDTIFSSSRALGIFIRTCNTCTKHSYDAITVLCVALTRVPVTKNNYKKKKK